MIHYTTVQIVALVSSSFGIRVDVTRRFPRHLKQIDKITWGIILNINMDEPITKWETLTLGRRGWIFAKYALSRYPTMKQPDTRFLSLSPPQFTRTKHDGRSSLVALLGIAYLIAHYLNRYKHGLHTCQFCTDNNNPICISISVDEMNFCEFLFGWNNSYFSASEKKTMHRHATVSAELRTTQTTTCVALEWTQRNANMRCSMLRVVQGNVQSWESHIDTTCRP